MTRQDIEKNLLRDMKWVERAVVTLDEANAWKNDDDRRIGSYMANWLRREKPQGQENHLTGQYVDRGRRLVLGYIEELLRLSLQATKDRIKKKEDRIKSLGEEIAELKRLEAKLVAEVSYLPGMEPTTGPAQATTGCECFTGPGGVTPPKPPTEAPKIGEPGYAEWHEKIMNQPDPPF